MDYEGDDCVLLPDGKGSLRYAEVSADGRLAPTGMVAHAADARSAAERRAVSRAVAEWNACFEAAGFKNALQIQEGEPEAAMAYHQLVFSYVMGREVFSQVSDPRTGEILCGRIALSNQELNDNLDLIAMSVGGYNPAFLTDSMPAVREEYIRYRMSNQTGLMLKSVYDADNDGYVDMYGSEF